MNSGPNSDIATTRKTRAQLIGLHLLVYLCFAWISGVFSNPAAALLSLALGAVLIWMSVVDIERFEIPDFASFLLAGSGAIATYVLNPTELAPHLLSGIAWGLCFTAISLGYQYFRGRIGLGLGDAKLIAGAAIWLGWQPIISVVLFASFGGVAFLLLVQFSSKQAGPKLGETAIAFGPFLCLSVWAVWLFGPLGF